MTFKSFLSAFGHDFVSVFHWVGSAQGQKTVVALEQSAIVAGDVIAGPAAGSAIASVENLINIGLKGVLSMEASAAAVGAQNGTGAQKSVAVAAMLTPQIEALLKQLGLDNPTVQQVESVANSVTAGLAGILNTLPAPVAAPSKTTP